MNTRVEFNKIREAFKRSKEDIKYLHNNIVELDKYKTNKTNIEDLTREIEVIKAIVIDLNDKLEEKQYSNKLEKKETLHKLQIIGNKDSKKLHFSNCPFGKKITDEHKIVFNGLNDSLMQQYDRCICVEN